MTSAKVRVGGTTARPQRSSSGEDQNLGDKDRFGRDAGECSVPKTADEKKRTEVEIKLQTRGVHFAFMQSLGEAPCRPKMCKIGHT